MQQAEREIADLGIRVLVVTFEAHPAARAYVEETGTRWPVISDESRSLYEAYGMGRARWRHLLGPSALLAYLREVARGPGVVRRGAMVTAVQSAVRDPHGQSLAQQRTCNSGD